MKTRNEINSYDVSRPLAQGNHRRTTCGRVWPSTSSGYRAFCFRSERSIRIAGSDERNGSSVVSTVRFRRWRLKRENRKLSRFEFHFTVKMHPLLKVSVGQL